MLKVPRQANNNNNCCIYMSLFVKHFMEDLDIYKDDPAKYVESVHDWFSEEDSIALRVNYKTELDTLFTFNVQHNNMLS